MKYGVNTFVWVSPCTTEAVKELSPKVKSMGFDILEIAVEIPDLINEKAVNDILSDHQLEGVVCGVFGSDRNICSLNPKIRKNAKTYIRRLIKIAQRIGSNIVCGPMYSSVGKDHLEDIESRMKEWDLAVLGIREMADYADTKDVRLALEPIHRYKSDMINVASQGIRFITDVDRENVGLHLDTYHMHLEEKSSAKAIQLTGDKLFHFHACENDRGIPGTGQVRWQQLAQALKEVGYSGSVVIESFTSQVKEIAWSLSNWREVAPSQDAIAQQGLQFLKLLLD